MSSALQRQTRRDGDVMRLIPPISAVLLAIGLSLVARERVLGDAAGALDIVAQIAVWLGTAWLGQRAVGIAIYRYSAWKSRVGRAPQFLESGGHLLTDVLGLMIFGAAVFGIVGIVLHKPITGLLATSGLFAAIIGLALQRMIADVFSGLALTVERPFAIGDWIEIGSGLAGKIIEANWRAVHLLTIEGRAVVIPNSVLANNQFVNVTAPERHFRLKRTICLDYSVPGERVVPILQAAMEATSGVLKVPKPIVLIDEANDRGVVYSLNFWVSDYPDQFPVSREVVISALRFLDQAALVPAYPKRDITISEAASRRIERRIDLPSVLGRVPLLSVLDSEQVLRLAETGNLREFPVDTVIVSEGEPGESLYIVVAGMLDVSRGDADGRVRTIGRLQPGDVFGEMSLLTGAPRSATVTAASPVTLVEISKEHLEPIFRSQPAVITQLAEIEAARMSSNRDLARLTAPEHAEIEEIGFSRFLRRKILGFFGHPVHQVSDP
jgi:small-conductance mechanosensitive channel/CRP-like cAMP-binding protein